MKIKDYFRKMFAVMAIISLLFQFGLAPIALAAEEQSATVTPNETSAIAPAATPESTVTAPETPVPVEVAPVPTSAPTPESTPGSEFSPSPVATPAPTPQSTVSATPVVNPTPSPISTPAESSVGTINNVIQPVWQTSDNSSTTTNNVELGQTYVAPQNSSVTVKFTKLPETTGKLTIKEIKLTSSEQKASGSLSDTVYDITSDMSNGTFNYDLTLPIPSNIQNRDITVKSAETVSGLNNASEVTQAQSKISDKIEIKDLNHFTIFVVTEPLIVSTDVTSDNATLRGTNGESDATGHSFWVSLATFDTSSSTIPTGVYSTPDLGPVAATTSFFASLASITITGVPTNLPAVTPNTTYYYAAWSNVGGTWYPGPGGPLSFTTAPLGSVFIDSIANGTLDPGELTFATIQAAINDPTSADKTIIVGANTYGEDLTVDKSLTIKGAGETTIINGNINVTGDNVTIQNLKITNSDSYGYGVKATEGKAVTLENVTVNVLYYGVRMTGGTSTPGTAITLNNSRIKGYAAIYLDGAGATNAVVNIDNTDLTGTTSYGDSGWDDFAAIVIANTSGVQVNFIDASGTSIVTNEFTGGALAKEHLMLFINANAVVVMGTPTYTNTGNSTVNPNALFVSGYGYYTNTVQGQVVARYVQDTTEFETALASVATTPIVVGRGDAAITTLVDSTLNAGTTLVIEANNAPTTISVGTTLVNNGTIIIEPGTTFINNGEILSVSITGTAKYGQLLTATIAGLTGAGTPTYQWKRDGSDIGGATASTYTLVTADIGTVITVTATTTGITGTGFITSNATVVIDQAPSATVVSCPVLPETYNGSAIEPCTAVVTGAGGLSTDVLVDYTDNTNAGTAHASATYAGDLNHSASSDSNTFTIDKASAVINVSGFTGAYDGSAHGATGTAVGVEEPPADLNSLLHLGSSFTVVTGGTAHWTFDGNSNYNSTSGDAVITISKVPVTVTADAQGKEFGTSDPISLAYHITSGALVSPDAFTGSIGRVAGESVGSYAIKDQGTLTLSGNYDLSFVAGIFTIVDTTAPATTDNINGDWHNSIVTVNLTCNDSGSGCANTYYSVNGLPYVSGNSFSISGDGKYTIKYYSVDNAGNSEDVLTAINQVKIETVDPSSTVSTSGIYGPYSTPTWSGEISGTTTDSNGAYGSGIQKVLVKVTDPNGDIITGFDGTEATLDGSGNWILALSADQLPFDGIYNIVSDAIDNAGNSEISDGNGSFTWDSTPPTVTGVENNHAAYDQPVAIEVSSDAATITLNGNPYVSDTAIGTNGSYQLIATDAYGNAAVIDFTIDIAPVISGETSSSVSETSATITWTTDQVATSRVVYDTVSHPSIVGYAEGSNYGYNFSTGLYAEKVTNHSVMLADLTPGTTYYYRTVSSGSPETTGEEMTFATYTQTTDNSVILDDNTQSHHKKKPTPVTAGQIINAATTILGGSSPAGSTNVKIASSVVPVNTDIATSPTPSASPTVSPTPAPIQKDILGTDTANPNNNNNRNMIWYWVIGGVALLAAIAYFIRRRQAVN